MSLFIIVIKALVIASAYSQEFCNVIKESDKPVLNGIDVIASLQSCIDNLEQCHEGIQAKQSSELMKNTIEF